MRVSVFCSLRYYIVGCNCYYNWISVCGHDHYFIESNHVSNVTVLCVFHFFSRIMCVCEREFLSILLVYISKYCSCCLFAVWYFRQDAIFPFLQFSKEASYGRCLPRCLIDNAITYVIVSSQWITIVTLVMPILFGYQHHRFFHGFTVNVFCVSCTLQYILWNCFRIYLTNRHTILLNIQQYGSWYRLPSDSDILLEMQKEVNADAGSSTWSNSNIQTWKYNQKYVYDDVVSVPAPSPIGFNKNAKDSILCYYQLKSSSSCIPEADTVYTGPEYDFVNNCYNTYVYIAQFCGFSVAPVESHCFPLTSLTWCCCYPVMYCLMSSGATDTCWLRRILEEDRGSALTSKVLLFIMLLITICTIAQAAIGFLISKVNMSTDESLYCDVVSICVPSIVMWCLSPYFTNFYSLTLQGTYILLMALWNCYLIVYTWFMLLPETQRIEWCQNRLMYALYVMTTSNQSIITSCLEAVGLRQGNSEDSALLNAKSLDGETPSNGNNDGSTTSNSHTGVYESIYSNSHIGSKRNKK